MKYRLTKIAAHENPLTKSASSIEEYRNSLSDGKFSPPIEYYIEGEPLCFPNKGECFAMSRDNRNGVKIFGFFTSTMVVDVSEGEDFTLFSTENSIYKLGKLVDNS